MKNRLSLESFFMRKYNGIHSNWLTSIKNLNYEMRLKCLNITNVQARRIRGDLIQKLKIVEWTNSLLMSTYFFNTSLTDTTLVEAVNNYVSWHFSPWSCKPWLFEWWTKSRRHGLWTIITRMITIVMIRLMKKHKFQPYLFQLKKTELQRMKKKILKQIKFNLESIFSYYFFTYVLSNWIKYLTKQANSNL